MANHIFLAVADEKAMHTLQRFLVDEEMQEMQEEKTDASMGKEDDTVEIGFQGSRRSIDPFLRVVNHCGSENQKGHSFAGSDKCFFVLHFQNDRLSPRDLQAWDCATKNAKPATIKSEVENKAALAAILDQDQSQAWIAATDTAKEGTFVWDGETAEMEYSNWDQNEPNNYGFNENCARSGEDCAVIRSNGKWNDLNCNDRSYSLCMAKDLEWVAPPAGVEKAICGNWYGKDKVGYTFAGTNKCYFVTKPELSVSGAMDHGWNTHCNRYGSTATTSGVQIWGQPANIRTADENKAAVAAYQHYQGVGNTDGKVVWIGATDHQQEGTWKWIWSRSEEVRFTNWDDGEPNNYVNPYRPGDEDCAAMWKDDGKWADLKCFQEARAWGLCEAWIGPPIIYNCGSYDGQDKVGFQVENGNKCYFVTKPEIKSDYTSFSAGVESPCTRMGGKPAVIMNANENKAAFAAYQHYNVASDAVNFVWFGATDSTNEGSWTWDFPNSNNEELEYTNWDKNEPNNHVVNGGGTEDCATMWRNEGKWNDVSCYERGWSLCEVEVSGRGLPRV